MTLIHALMPYVVIVALAVWLYFEHRITEEYRLRWRKSVEIMEQVQVENERLIEERNEAVEISQGFSRAIEHLQKKSMNAELETHARDYRAQLNAMLEQQRKEQQAKRDRLAARLMAKRGKSIHYPPSPDYPKALAQAVRTARRKGLL